MFSKTTQYSAPLLDEMIASAHSEAVALGVETDEYAAAVKNIAELYKIRLSIEEKTDKFSKDQILAVVGNIAGIIAILGYERAHVVTSKALGFVLKSKV
jgi:hypothetical protein